MCWYIAILLETYPAKWTKLGSRQQNSTTEKKTKSWFPSEQWELEVERRTKSRTARSTETGPERDEVAIPFIEKDSKSDPKAEVVKEA